MRLSGIAVTGWGAVSPAGWGAPALSEAWQTNQPLPSTPCQHPGLPEPISVRKVPPPPARPAFTAHPRLRRSSAISSHAAAAALEALERQLPEIQGGHRHLGIIYTAMTGCVSYSRRFYDETLKDPSTASPILFPETVGNAPASHLASYLNSNDINYTLIGDAGSFLQGLALGAAWLMDGRIDTCVVVGAEESDWLTAGAQRLFNAQIIVGEGAGALVLERQEPAGSGIQLDFVTQPALYTAGTTRQVAIARVQEIIRASGTYDILFDSLTGVGRVDAAELKALVSWSGQRASIKSLCGESFAASSAWQSVLAVYCLAQGSHQAAAVAVAGCNQQAIGAGFSCPTGRLRN